jgi:hypothetical protein
MATPRSFLFKAASKDDKTRWLAALQAASDAVQQADATAPRTAPEPAVAASAGGTKTVPSPAMKARGLSLARERFSRAIALSSGSKGDLRGPLSPSIAAGMCAPCP